MHNLSAITPLGKQDAVTETIGPVTLREVTDMALVSVAARLGQESAAKKALKGVIGTLPPETQEWTSGDLSAFWMGPDQWMVEAPIETHEDLAALIGPDCKGLCSVTEQTDAWCRFDLTGERLADVFELLCPAPVRGFAGNEAVRTTIDHLGCFLVNRGDNHVSVLGPRSSAGSLFHALITAMKSAL